MNRGVLARYFEGIASKTLSAVEAHPERSHQHEFGGVTDLRRILGEDDQKFVARFIYLGQDEMNTAVAESSVTWYDSRKQNPLRSAEFRLYFPTTSVSEKAHEGDLLVVGRRPDKTLLVIVAERGSTAENQVRWLFGLPESEKFFVRELGEADLLPRGFVANLVLEQLGIEPEPTGPVDYLPLLLDRFGETFPPTKVFSRFARETLDNRSVRDDPDEAILAWMDQEEALFRTLEKHLLARRLLEGFGPSGDDVDQFIEVSLSVQNRRKSRAGSALENHLEVIFQEFAITYSRGEISERLSRPDFIFPGITQYRDTSFSERRLSMLGAKSSAKERWRQVLAEADRIQEKHLFTLEPGISENQTSEMQSHLLQLVVPKTLHRTYTAAQQARLMDLMQFLTLVKDRQGD